MVFTIGMIYVVHSTDERAIPISYILKSRPYKFKLPFIICSQTGMMNNKHGRFIQEMDNFYRF